MKLALFDLDHTLLDVDSDYLWGEFLIAKGVVDEEAFRKKNNEFYHQYLAGTLDAKAYNESNAKLLSQFDLSRLDVLRHEYIDDYIRPKVRPKAMDAVHSHQSSGHQTLIISATNDFIVSGIATIFGVPPTHVIATRLEVNDKGYTGRVLGEPNFQAGKLTNLHAWLAGQADKPSHSWGYSDSYNDLPLLEFVDDPFAVTPDERLKSHALMNDWPILEW